MRVNIEIDPFTRSEKAIALAALQPTAIAVAKSPTPTRNAIGPHPSIDRRMLREPASKLWCPRNATHARGQMARSLNILIHLHQEEAFDRRAFRAMAARSRDSGVILHALGRGEKLQNAVRNHQAAGIIISSDDPETVAEVIATGKPCVNISNHLRGHHLAPVIGTDDAAIGAMVAEYYLSRGFRSFAYFSQLDARYFAPRQKGFVDALERSGFACAIGPAPHAPLNEGTAAHSERDQDQSWEWRAGQWLASLPTPLAVFAPYDWHARQAVTACQLVGLQVPAEVSVVGVDNDEITCTSIWPPLSSVDTHAAQVGSEAITLLRAMIVDGQTPPPQPVLVPPLGIVTRGSSSESAVIDPDIAAAIHFIQANVNKRIIVDDVARHVVISRRTLERRFLTTIGRSPMEEIRRSRIERAKQLLIQTDLDLAEVARRSGLIRQQRLCSVLKETTGHTPLTFRMMYRQGGENPGSA